MTEPSPAPEKKREEWLEISRVLAALCIIYTHTSIMGDARVGEISKIIMLYARIPFFLFLAGYFTRWNISMPKWGNRILNLLIPYVLWNIICATSIYKTCNIKHFCGDPENFWLPADGPMWFVCAMIVMVFLVPLFRCIRFFMPVIILVCFTMNDIWKGTWFENYCNPYLCGFFLLGLMFSPIKLTSIYHALAPHAWKFLICGLLFAFCRVYFYLAEGDMLSYGPLISTYGIAMIFCAGIVIQHHLPHLAKWITSLAPACFLSFALHLMLLNYIKIVFPPATYTWLSILSPPVIFLCIAWMFHLMRKYAPWLLPWLAYVNQHKFFKEKRCGG